MGPEVAVYYFFLIFFIAFFFTSILLVGSFLLTWIVHRSFKKPLWTTVTALVCLLVLTFDIPLGAREFARICEERAGIKAYRALEPVKGIRFGAPSCGSNCVELLKSFEFVELDWQYFGSEFKRLGFTPGLYRISLAEDDSEMCQQNSGWRRFLSLEVNEGKCIAVKPLANFSSSYEFIPPWIHSTEDLQYDISSREASIVDASTKEVISTQGSYTQSARYSWSGLSAAWYRLETQECDENLKRSNEFSALLSATFRTSE